MNIFRLPTDKLLPDQLGPCRQAAGLFDEWKTFSEYSPQEGEVSLSQTSSWKIPLRANQSPFVGQTILQTSVSVRV